MASSTWVTTWSASCSWSGRLPRLIQIVRSPGARPTAMSAPGFSCATRGSRPALVSGGKEQRSRSAAANTLRPRSKHEPSDHQGLNLDRFCPTAIGNMAMLKRFLYLDESELTDYVSALEGGLRGPRELKSVRGGKRDAGIDVKAAKGGIEKSEQSEETLSFTDTAHARFERFLELAAANPEGSGWIEVLDASRDLQEAGFGAMISVECDLYIPDIIKALAMQGGLADTLDQIETFLPYAAVFDLDISGLPSKEEREAIKGVSRLFGGKLVVVGELDDTDWLLAGQLDASNVRDPEIEGRVIVVGKITKKWGPRQWKPLLALPGSSLLPRHQRRMLERKPPEAGQEDQYLEGPAVMIDILAIYR